MPLRAALALLLLFPAAALAQELDRAVGALVRIVATRGGTPVRGSGFVVGLEGNRATILTASHVVEGVEQLTVVFAADPAEAVFAVQGREPPSATGGLLRRLTLGAALCVSVRGPARGPGQECRLPLCACPPPQAVIGPTRSRATR